MYDEKDCCIGMGRGLDVFFMAAQAQSVKMNPKTDNALLTRFQDAKLGLFVHWMACHTPTTGDSWSIGRGTPKTVADSITMSWNPEKFDARRIVDVAVQSGCRYMVVISKHHDDFCIWPSAYSDFDLDRGAFHRDMLKELGDECRKRGLLFGIYYSIADIDYCGWTRMPEEQVARLHELTDWIEAHQDTVYGTRGGPYRQTDQLGSTYRGKKLVSSYS